MIKIDCHFKNNKNVTDVEISYDFTLLTKWVLGILLFFVISTAIADLNYLNWSNLKLFFFWALAVVAIPYFGLPFHIKFLLKKQFG